MSSLRKLIFLLIPGVFFLCSQAWAGLSGFTSANPYTREEEILKIDTPPVNIPNYRQEMRDNVTMLSDYAKGRNPDFEIIVHEGRELLKKGLWEYHLQGYNEARRLGYDAKDPTFLARIKDLSPEFQTIGTGARTYMKKIDAVALNNYFCSRQDFTPPNSLKLISIDKCPDEDAFDEAIQDSVGRSALLYVFTSPQYAFKNIRSQIIINENAKNVFSLDQAQNIVFLLDTSEYPDKFALIEDIRNANYDIVVLPAFVNGVPFTKEEVNSLKFKKNGTRRRVIAAFNISETDDGQYYWQPEWRIGSPEWLKRLSFVDKDGILVEYWAPEWKNIISKYFKGIVDLDFDGAFLTGLENYRYFEQQTPLE